MAVKPKDETGRDWNWAGGDNAAIHNHFEENRLSARTPSENKPTTGKFGADAVLISHSDAHQRGLPCFGALAEVGGDLDISTGNFCIAGWLFLGTFGMAAPVDFDIWGYSQYGIQRRGARYLNGRTGSDYVYYDGVYDAKFSFILDTAILTDGTQTSYSLVNGVWVPVTYDYSTEYDTYVTLHAVIENAEWDNEWHYVAFARYGTELAVYFDGQKRASWNYAGSLPCCNGTDNKLYIGHGFVPV